MRRRAATSPHAGASYSHSAPTGPGLQAPEHLLRGHHSGSIDGVLHYSSSLAEVLDAFEFVPPQARVISRQGSGRIEMPQCLAMRHRCRHEGRAQSSPPSAWSDEELRGRPRSVRWGCRRPNSTSRTRRCIARGCRTRKPAPITVVPARQRGMGRLQHALTALNYFLIRASTRRWRRDRTALSLGHR